MPLQPKNAKNVCSVDGKESVSEHYYLKPQKGYHIRLSLVYVLLFRSMNVECLAWWIGNSEYHYLYNGNVSESPSYTASKTIGPL